jgi:hypothetical protein
MTTDRPDKYPDWAMNDVVEPISGQNNVIEPPQVKKDEGWGYRDKGARNWFNWLSRYTANWIRYLDAPATFTVGTVPLNVNYPLGKTIYVTDAAGGAQLAYNNGTNWLRVRDGTIIN